LEVEGIMQVIKERKEVQQNNKMLKEDGTFRNQYDISVLGRA
jgi:hypothetical protein